MEDQFVFILKSEVMKQLFNILILATGLSSIAHAQSNKTWTDTLKVDGNCEMCKKRIEKAAYGKGVRHAEWNKENQNLILVYRPDRTELAKIRQRILDVGHSVDQEKASEEAYQRLPACCHYKTQAVH